MPRSKSVSRAELNDILGSRRIERVVVLGANGAMGYGSGALFTTVVQIESAGIVSPR